MPDSSDDVLLVLAPYPSLHVLLAAWVHCIPHSIHDHEAPMWSYYAFAASSTPSGLLASWWAPAPLCPALLTIEGASADT